MKSEKLKQISAAILVVLSLFVSSVAACCCSHHQEKTAIETPSCHAEKHPTENRQESANADSADFYNIPCECFAESAPKVFAKSENIKVEKQSAKLALSIYFENREVLPNVSGVKVDFSTPFHITRFFDNLKSPRAPPIV